MSARNAYPRATVYYAASYVFLDGTENADSRLSELFAAHRKCFDLDVGLLDPQAIAISVPYEIRAELAWMPISSLARLDSGIVSVGLKAELLVSDTYR